MRIYHVEKDLEDTGFFFIVVNGNPNVCRKVFDNANAAWKHAKKLATRYAKRYGVNAVYTKHPKHNCWAYIIRP